MNLIDLDSWGSYSRAFDESFKAILAGKLIVYPTDTVYGIGADATNANAVRKVTEAKGRENKPISIAVSDFSMMGKYCRTKGVSFSLLQQLFPGPVTGVFLKSYDFPNELTSKDTIAIRMPHHHFVLSLVRKLGIPITSTSANLSGGRSPKSLEEVPKEIRESVSAVVDGGRCHHGTDSTIIDFTAETPRIIREGADAERIKGLIRESRP